MNALELTGPAKKHRVSKSGAKADKKRDHKKKKLGQSTERHNPKAFSVANIVRTKRTQQRNLDRAQKKEVVPLVNRADELPPPTMVVVMGPAGCGKSTLIRSLVKMFTNQNLSDTKGPITCVAGKKRRITLFECPLDMYSMTDLAKVADLVILMVDASYGFEMETFEFLNMLQLHGFPKVIGVMSHLDKFKMSKTLQNTKKALKHRFWTEIYKGAKMFELSGAVNGKYLKHEVKRLSLYLMRVKYRPLTWRNTHPFVVVDRVEDVTPMSKVAADSECDRDVTIFGYVRGTHLKESMRIHLIGAGDFDISVMSALPDPCPLPGQGDSKKTSLKSKDTLLYAPMANVGRVQISERDGVYIDLKSIHYTKKEHLQLGDKVDEEDGGHSRGGTSGGDYGSTPADLLRSMQDVKKGVDELLHDSELSLFRGSKSVRSSQVVESDDEESDGENGSEDDNDDYADENDEEEEDDDDDNNSDQSEEGEEDGDDEQFSFDGDENYDDFDGETDDKIKATAVKKSLGEDKEGSSGKWKEDMKSKAVSSFLQRVTEGGKDLMQRVYGVNWEKKGAVEDFVDEESDNEDEDDDDDELFNIKSTSSKKDKYNEQNRLDSHRAGTVDKTMMERLRDWKEAFSKLSVNDTSDSSHMSRSLGSLLENGSFTIKEKFVTGSWGGARKPGMKPTGKPDANANNNADDDEEIYGDFEDLQTGEVFNGKNSASDDDDDDEGSDDDNDDNDDENSDDEEEESDSEEKIDAKNDEIDKQLRELNAERKKNTKSAFDAEYDTKGNGDNVKLGAEEEEEEKMLDIAKKMQEEQRERNKQEFGEDGELVRLRHEGFRQGLYVRIILRGVSVEFTRNFRPQLPVIMGGLLPHEMEMGYINARVKRHRWHRRVLKSNDPLVFSIGWRRYQSIPVFTIEDQNERERYLKYTPEHMHCKCTFYGPVVPPNTGILAFQKSGSNQAGFRLSLTGTALEQQATTTAVKKLKLVGTPTKIFKNTAFITGMFNSALEVAKFEGAKLKTVSGIRGQVKKALRDGTPGHFRATFEDKILMSDIVVCRLWVPVEVKQFYNPVLTMLTAESPEEWKGMRTTAQVRRENEVGIPINKDSLYKPIVRVPREFRKFSIPKKLEESLPFESKPKLESGPRSGSYLSRRAVILEPEDRKKRAIVSMLSAVEKDKVTKRKETKAAKAKENAKKRAKAEEKFAPLKKEERKRKFTEEGKESARREAKIKSRKVETGN